MFMYVADTLYTNMLSMYLQLQSLMQKLMVRDFVIFGKEKACIEHLISELWYMYMIIYMYVNMGLHMYVIKGASVSGLLA